MPLGDLLSAISPQLEANILRMQMDMRAQQIEFELRAKLNTDISKPINAYRCVNQSSDPRCRRPLGIAERYIHSDKKGVFCLACGGPAMRIGATAIYDLGTTHGCMTREEWVASIAKSDQRWTAVQGCQAKADYMAEVVAHDRANDPPELYWRFRFPEEVAVVADPPVAQESWKTDQRGWDEWRKRRYSGSGI